MNALSEAEMRRLLYRRGLFQLRGLSPHEAHALAMRLKERDLEKDDRRLCLECRHLRRSGNCMKPKHYPIPTLLQRCRSFDWMTP